MQNAIARSFIEMKHKTDIVLPEIQMNSYPDRISEMNFLRVHSIGSTFGILILLIMVFPAINAQYGILTWKKKNN